MRAIDKGNPPNSYTKYQDARDDLAEQIGWFCSYCEMPVKNMIEVEHVIPQAKGGNELDWDNFLLSCRYCNGIKGRQNQNRDNYLWPDQDNTTEAFDYSESKVIEPNNSLNTNEALLASNTIDLTGLDRKPYTNKEPTERDTRWINRINVWGVINESYNDWQVCPLPAFARQIARTALGHGFYSCWIVRFAAIPVVIHEINQIFPNTHISQRDASGNLIVRPLGRF